jgi:PTH1 family peptidyl-tRNA hydrolase
MYLIAGLGNPGAKYHNTRHNIGFIVIDKLADFFKIESFELEELYLFAAEDYKEKKLVLMKPLTFMNLSGRAVKEFSDRYEIPKENILIVYDDVNLPFGTLRMRPSGSDGGQNGMGSVIYEFQSEDISRLRIGIKHDEELEKVTDEQGSVELIDYVLDEFSDDELKGLDKVITAARDAVLSFIDAGITETMNSFNKNFLDSEIEKE